MSLSPEQCRHGRDDTEGETVATGGLAVTPQDGYTGVQQDPELLPAGVELRTYRQAVEGWGQEAVHQAWLKTNNEAFSWHPEQGGWTLQQLEQALEAPWVDTEGIFFLCDRSGTNEDGSGAENPAVTEKQGELVIAGFHWTKQHPPHTDADHTRRPGEIYVIGLGDRYRGQGLGQVLLRAGMDYLLQSGATELLLYVEADNEPALAAYRRLGFSVTEEHVVYARRP